MKDKDTIRLILTLDCNLSCSYCCNKLESVYSRFIQKSLEEIDFSRYQNICLTGGEPFLNKPLLYEVLEKIPDQKNVYIYTNGLLIDYDDLLKLFIYGGLKLTAINIGLHSIGQLKQIDRRIEETFNVRYLAQDICVEKLLTAYPERLTVKNLKGWHLNKCDQPNEDWVLLR